MKIYVKFVFEKITNFINSFKDSEREIFYNKSYLITPERESKVCIVYLVSPRESTHSDNFSKIFRASKMDIFIESVKQARQFLPCYPILVFNEDYTTEDEIRIKNETSAQDMTFIKVDFKKYKEIGDVDSILRLPDAVPGRPGGYRMMCRFFSGVLQGMPELKDFEYYIRLDHDSFFMAPDLLNLNEVINKHDFDYLYRSIWYDKKEIKTLWKFTKKYASINNLSLDGFKELKMLDRHGDYNGRSPYNNFHMSKLEFWRRPDVLDYLNAVESIDGIIKLHWHDTTIQAMLLGLFRPRILEKMDFGYRHNTHYSLPNSLKIAYKNSWQTNDFP